MKKTIAIVCVMMVLMVAAVFGESGFGAAGAKESAPSWSIEQMLMYAIQDEYLARAEYVKIIDVFKADRPFTNIKRAEDQHISMLVEVYKVRGLEIPSDTAASHVVLPASLEEAYRIGVQAEIDNIAMYEGFLKNPLLADIKNADLRDVFEKLKRASESHLLAFQKQL